MYKYRLERDGLFFADFIFENSAVINETASLRDMIDSKEKMIKSVLMKKYIHHNHKNDVKMPRKGVDNANAFNKKDNVIKREVLNLIGQVYKANW